jgi:endonuclease/exonuclease/phosphatase (EEP) superfamily protein YafD
MTTTARFQKGCAGVLLLTMVGIWAIALGSSRYGWPLYLELLAHFQRQYWLMNLGVLGLLGLTRQRFCLLIGLGLFLAHTTLFTPWYWPPGSGLPSPDPNLRVLVSNINTQNRNYEGVVAFTRQANPDLAVFMEVDAAWIEQLRSLQDELPYASGQGNSDNFGLVVYSRWPLDQTRVELFGSDRNISVVGQVTIAGQPVHFAATHPYPPVRPSIFQARNQQLDRVGQYVQALPSPKLLLGDLNVTMWSPYYRRLTRQAGVVNARRGLGIHPTWPTPGTYRRLPKLVTPLLTIPIDHCLISRDITVSNLYVGPNIGSDHLPLVADLHIPAA